MICRRAIIVSGDDDGTFCGLVVEYPGTGDSRDNVQLGDTRNHNAKLPFTFKRVFSKPGTYEAKAFGGRVSNAFGCRGSTSTTFVITPPPVVAVVPSGDPLEQLAREAQGNNPEAMYALANAFANQGKDVEAVKWFRSAMMLGHVKATNALGFMYEEGRGTPQNLSAAAEHYLQAMKKGNADAMVNRGFLYQKGLGVERNEPQAYFHFLLAAAYASDKETRDEATKLRNETAQKLTREQVQQAQAVADKFAREEIK